MPSYSLEECLGLAGTFHDIDEAFKDLDIAPPVKAPKRVEEDVWNHLHTSAARNRSKLMYKWMTCVLANVNRALFFHEPSPKIEEFPVEVKLKCTGEINAEKRCKSGQWEDRGRIQASDTIPTLKGEVFCFTDPLIVDQWCYHHRYFQTDLQHLSWYLQLQFRVEWNDYSRWDQTLRRFAARMPLVGNIWIEVSGYIESVYGVERHGLVDEDEGDATYMTPAYVAGKLGDALGQLSTARMRGVSVRIRPKDKQDAGFVTAWETAMRNRIIAGRDILPLKPNPDAPRPDQVTTILQQI